MDFKKFLRGPLIYILLAVVVVSIGFSLLSGGGFKQITTQEGLELLNTNKVATATVIDGEQRVDLVLTNAGDDGANVQFNYAKPRG